MRIDCLAGFRTAKSPDDSVLRAFNVLRDDYAVVGTLDNLTSAMHRLAEAAIFRTDYIPAKRNATIDSNSINVD